MRDNVTSGSVDDLGGLGWRASLARAGGGIAMDGGLHWIRPLREMLNLRIDQVVGIVRRGLAPELQMEGESVGHVLFQMDTAGDKPEGAGPLVATYSCNMLATAPMAHDACPYFLQPLKDNVDAIIQDLCGWLKLKEGEEDQHVKELDNAIQ